tara:strand:+ start:27340 stop:27999 length:660 start_codon:yes stop_codon:yes gene_type:complete
MKKLLVLLLTVFSLSSFAQDKISEGVIIMKQKIESDDPTVQAQLAMMGEMTSTTYFKKGKSRSEVSNQMSGDVTVIIDQDIQEMLMLMDGPMGKLYGKKSTNLTEEELKKVTVTEIDETKTILGYKSKRYDLVVKDQGVETTIKFYMTDAIEIQTQQTALYGGKLKGMPMYMEMEMNQMGMEMIMKFEVVEVKKESVDDSKFDMAIPEGYKENNMILGN